MKKNMQTPSQTIGPFFAYSLAAPQYGYDFTEVMNGTMVAEDVAGDRIIIRGRVLNGNGEPISDALIEFWQSDIKAFGRFGTGTDPLHRFVFETIKPKSAEGQAPHIVVIVFMRGLLVHAYTRLYFSDEMIANQNDAVLKSVPEARRATLIAKRKDENGKIVYELDIVMQGEGETVFFDV